MTDWARDPVLVTGGGGFLGSAIVRLLNGRGLPVRSLARRRSAELDALGVAQIQGDVADPAVVSQAVEGCLTVFHVAAKAGLWGPFPEYHRVNVVGTENVIAACRRHGVRRLIYTSSPSVVFTGHDLEGVDESVPYANRYDAAYPATKAIAEKLVLAANDSSLATISLRPHLIWGPGDNNILPRVFAPGAGEAALSDRPPQPAHRPDLHRQRRTRAPDGRRSARAGLADLPEKPTSSRRASLFRSGIWSIASSKSRVFRPSRAPSLAASRWPWAPASKPSTPSVGSPASPA